MLPLQVKTGTPIPTTKPEHRFVTAALQARNWVIKHAHCHQMSKQGLVLSTRNYRGMKFSFPGTNTCGRGDPPHGRWKFHSWRCQNKTSVKKRVGCLKATGCNVSSYLFTSPPSSWRLHQHHLPHAGSDPLLWWKHDLGIWLWLMSHIKGEMRSTFPVYREHFSWVKGSQSFSAFCLW